MYCIIIIITIFAVSRSADVRKPANEAVLPLMKHLGYEPMRKATDKLSAVSKNTVSPLLEKARAELPPPPAAAPKAAAGGPKAVKPRAATAPASSAAATEAETKAPAAAGKPESKSAKPAAAKSRLGLNKPAGGGKKSGEDVDTSPLYQPNKLKNQRFKDETKLKVSSNYSGNNCAISIVSNTGWQVKRNYMYTRNADFSLGLRFYVCIYISGKYTDV